MVAVITAFREYVRGVDRVVLLFSGGADSSLLLALGAAVLGDRLTALTFTGPHTAPGELASAWSLARRLGVRHLVREMDLLTLPEFRYNTPARCYACKQTLTAQGWQMARAWGAHALWDGTNRDDLRDFRPGLKATREAGVASPLLELGLGKREIRKFSAALGLPGDKPPQSCLATRFGASVTSGSGCRGSWLCWNWKPKMWQGSCGPPAAALSRLWWLTWAGATWRWLQGNSFLLPACYAAGPRIPRP